VKSDLLLHKLLEAAGGPVERGYVLALDGPGLETVPDKIATSRATYSVCRPETELEIRHLLWKLQGAPFIALVKEALAHRLPADILKRAQGARVHAVDESSVIGAAIGVPHELKGEAIVAFVVLKGSRPADATKAKELAETLRAWVGKTIGPIAKPDEIRFGDNLPKTRSGKIMRRLLRAIAQGQEITQDVSTLENPAILEQLKEVIK